jgi:beta-lactamase regulating signal transducer with metallopeptidase domain
MNAIFGALVNGSIVSAAVTFLVWLVLRITSRTALNAATRYSVWSAVFGVSALIAILFMVLPRLNSGVPSQRGPLVTLRDPERVMPAKSTPIQLPPPEAAETVTSTRPLMQIEVQEWSWPFWIAAAWMAAGVMMLLRLLGSFVLLQGRRRGAQPLCEEMALRFDFIVREAGVQRRVDILVSADVTTPMAIGPIWPSIVLPARLVEDLSEKELDLVVRHEAAHLARFDDHMVVVQRTIQALFAFHPVMQWISRQIDSEREISCDDIVVATTGGAIPYASCLTRIAELCASTNGAGLGAFAANSRPVLVRRIELLLEDTRSVSIRLMKVRVAGFITTIVLLACIGLIAPRPITLNAATEVALPIVRAPGVPAVLPEMKSGESEAVAEIVKAPAAQQATLPTVNIQVVVTDSLGRYVSGLQKEHFRILEDRVEQGITQFVEGGPASVCLLADINNGNRGDEVVLQAAVTTVNQRMPGDEFCLVEFTPAPELTVSLTSDPTDIQRRVTAPRSAQPTSLLEGLQVALRALRSANNVFKAVFIVSDREASTFTLDNIDELRQVAAAADLPVIVLSSTDTTGLLAEVASATGGYQAAIRTEQEAQNQAVRALVRVRNSYILGFRSAASLGDGRFHQIEVQSLPPRGIQRLNVTHRAGYYFR